MKTQYQLYQPGGPDQRRDPQKAEDPQKDGGAEGKTPSGFKIHPRPPQDQRTA